MRPERIPIEIHDDPEALARSVAGRIADLVRRRAAEGRPAVLGLATGSTPLGVYRELIRMHREDELSFAGTVTFNLDEYLPMEPGSVHSYHRFMRENLFDHIDVPEAAIHIPRGDLAEGDLEAHCRAYEAAIREAGGIDLQLLGVGRTGHIGFNEPGSSRDSRTRVVTLDTITRRDAAADFFGEENVPARALTMGVATILEAREIALIATGEHKSGVIRRAVEGDVHHDVAATYLQEHTNATVYLDPAAAGELTRVATPWVLGEVEWRQEMELAAVTWLSGRVEKPVLHLAAADYRDHHLSSLLARHGSAGPLNGDVFNALIARIRGRSKLPSGKRALVFSPHPDDDVISMGGTLRKLARNDNDLVVAYQTSGNVAVFDHEVRRHLDFVRRTVSVLGEGADGALARIDDLEGRLARKRPGDIDDPGIRELKRAIRESEAVSALRTLGLGPGNARFLDLPFYRTGRVRKDPIGEEDVRITHELLEAFRPELVFAAGDLSDPHGTHRMCLEAVRAALARLTGPAPELWLYRGAWQEWPIHEATVLVPMSEDELRLKILAIFKHQSQKDRPPFPGPDDREFWQRVEARNRGTAALVDRLGLPAYFAMETFVVERDGERVPPETVPTASLRVAGEGGG